MTSVSVSSYEAYDPFKHYCGPGWLPTGVIPRAPDGIDFNPACYNHDKCYGTCATNCKTQYGCDADFKDDISDLCEAQVPVLEAACRQQHPYIGWFYCYGMMDSCKDWATTYQVAVNALGTFSFECTDEQTQYCIDHREENLATGEGYYDGPPQTLTLSGSIPYFKVNSTWSQLYGNQMNAAEYHIFVQNTGDEGGWVTINVSDCQTNELLGQKNEWVSGHQIKDEIFILEGLPITSCHAGRCLRVSLSNGTKVRTSTHTVPVYSGQVTGRVINSTGHSVNGVPVIFDTGESAITKSGGTFSISKVARYGQHTITASHPVYGRGQVAVNFTIHEYGKPSCEGLTAYSLQIQLNPEDIQDQITQTTFISSTTSTSSSLASTSTTTTTLAYPIFEIVCPIGDYTYKLTKLPSPGEKPTHSRQYTGSSTAVFVSRNDIVPGTYTLSVSKPEFNSSTQRIDLTYGCHVIVDCNLTFNGPQNGKSTSTTLTQGTQRATTTTTLLGTYRERGGK